LEYGTLSGIKEVGLDINPLFNGPLFNDMVFAGMVLMIEFDMGLAMALAMLAGSFMSFRLAMSSGFPA